MIERVIKTLEENKFRRDSGELIAIPWPLPRLSKVLPGIVQKRYTIVTANQKVGKTQIADFLYLYQPIEWLYRNKGSGKKLKIFYFSLEMNKEKKILAAMSYKLFTDYGYIISPENLQSIFESYVIDQKIIDIIKSKPMMDWLRFVEDTVEFHDDIRNPFGIYTIVKSYAEKNGRYEYKDIDFQDSNTGQATKKRVIDYYIPNNPEEYVQVIIDHYSLMSPEKGESLREAIGRFSSEYAIRMRDRFGYSVVAVQQQSADFFKKICYCAIFLLSLYKIYKLCKEKEISKNN